MDKNLSTNTIPEVAAEKFAFVQQSETLHDKKLETKPVGYFKGAFKRFCKNKGSVVAACVIAFLVLFAIIAPWCTPYSVSYSDLNYAKVLPRNSLFVNTNFWDGCKKNAVGKLTFAENYAIGLETGHNVVKNNQYKINDEGMYEYRHDTYFEAGCGKYRTVSQAEFIDIQRYQNETGIQVIYPTVRLRDRPEAEQDQLNANYYYKTRMVAGKTEPLLEVNSDPTSITPVYWTYVEGEDEAPVSYSSKRIEGENGFKNAAGKTCYYAYGRVVSGGVEIRASYYDYYIYQHTQVLKDGIKKPSFLFGTDPNGKDILTCLASGARFSFLFAIAVAAVNMLVGALYGSVEGYYGGKIDLIMERISDILSAVQFMIVITLLKLHMGGSGHMLVLFIAFFLTGWIGMAHTTRMQFYRFKNQEYVLAARTLGAKDGRLMFKHIFPNAIGTLVTSCALVIPSMIYSETNLTFLGIINLESGNLTSVGTLIAAGQACMDMFPHVVFFPSLFLALLMLSFNLFGNGLRDAFNPSLRGSEG